jgi:hypothetical protein
VPNTKTRLTDCQSNYHNFDFENDNSTDSRIIITLTLKMSTGISIVKSRYQAPTAEAVEDFMCAAVQ